MVPFKGIRNIPLFRSRIHYDRTFISTSTGCNFTWGNFTTGTFSVSSESTGLLRLDHQGRPFVTLTTTQYPKNTTFILLGGVCGSSHDWPYLFKRQGNQLGFDGGATSFDFHLHFSECVSKGERDMIGSEKEMGLESLKYLCLLISTPTQTKIPP